MGVCGSGSLLCVVFLEGVSFSIEKVGLILFLDLDLDLDLGRVCGIAHTLV